MGRKEKPFNPKIKVRYVSYGSEEDRDIRYKLWIDSHIRGIKLAQKAKAITAQQEAQKNKQQEKPESVPTCLGLAEKGSNLRLTVAQGFN